MEPNTGPPACLTAIETNFPKSKSSRTSPGTVRKPCLERRRTINIWCDRKQREKPFTDYVPNITPDLETGIGAWTDAQIVTAIREGKRPDGSTIGPPMPFGQYRAMSDRDAEAVVAYLRSLPAVKNPVPKSEYGFPLPPAYGPPADRVATIDEADRVAYGGYLAGPLGHCVECHTPMKEGRFDFEDSLGAGGFPIPVGGGAILMSANITPDNETGIGEWSDADIARAIARGLRPDGSRIHPIMPYGFYATMTSRDIGAIVAYLRSFPPVRSEGD